MMAAAGLALLASGAALAQDAAPAEPPESQPAPSDEIVVTGARESTLDLPRLLKAEAAFRAGRAEFAPTSSLWFQLRAGPDVALDGMTLELRRGDTRIAVPVDGDRRFTLPALPGGKWELVHNRGKARIAVRALVISAGAREEERPLGDLRLQCRAGWELAKADFGFLARAGFGALGGCSSTRFAFFFRTTRPIDSATLSDGARTETLKLQGDRKAFRAPLGAKEWPNSAVVRVGYQ